MQNNNTNNKQAALCSVCLEAFSSAIPHRPKMLLCGHTTCESCIFQWTNRSNPPLVQCPHCRKQFPDLKVDDVAVNYLALELMADDSKLLERERKKQRKDNDSSVSNSSPSSIKCEIDPHCPHPVSHRCLQCPHGNQLMCENHLAQHSLVKAFSATHHPIRIGDLPSSSSSLPSPPSCSDHIGMPLTIHCWDCAKPLCDRCSMFAHKTHSYTEIHEAVDKIKTDLQVQLDSINEMMDKWRSLDGDVTSSVERIRGREEELLKMTDRMWDELRDAVENGRISMKKQVVDIMQHRYNSETKMLEEVKQKMKDASEIMEKGQAAIAEKDCATAASGGCETARHAKQFLDEYRDLIKTDIDRAMIITKKKQEEEEKGLQVDLAKLNEAKMMMEEGMRGAMVALWAEHAAANHNNNSNDNNHVDINNESELEKKRKVIRGLVERGLSLKPRSHIDCSNVEGVAWSPDGNSVYVTGGGKGIRQININSGRIIKTIGAEEIHSPFFISVSKTGDLYVSDSEQDKVYVLSSSTGQTIRQIGSTKGAADGQFDRPYSLCIVDEWNEFFVADENNQRIQVFSMADGHFIRKFGTKGAGQGQFSNPAGIAVDTSEGFIFVSECGNARIQVFDRDGKSIRIIGSKGAANGQLSTPHGIVVDPTSKQLVVCDLGNNRLCIFDYEGNFVGIISPPLMEEPWFICINENHRLAFSCFDYAGIFFQDLLHDNNDKEKGKKK